MGTDQTDDPSGGATQQFVDFAVTTFRQGVPEAVEHAAQRQLIDSIGVGLAAHDEASVRGVEQLIQHWLGTDQPATSERLAQAPDSYTAFIAGTRGHALDFDDTHLPSVLHPSANVVSAALAVGRSSGASREQLLRAVALGNELTVRLGMAGYDEDDRDSIYFARGFHATSICGAVGAALAASLLRGLSAAQVLDAVAVASSFGAGLLEANRTGGTVKRLHCGWAAFSGVTATDLVRMGITGPPTVFEGRFGFVQAFCGDRARPELVTEGLGQHWEAERIGFKPYPTNGFTHAVIDAALELRKQGVRPAEVQEVEVRVPKPVLRTIAEPRDVKIRPASPYNARFSAPFVFALALRGGSGLGVGIDDFTEASITDDVLLDLCAKTEVRSDPDCDAAFPDEIPAIVAVTLTDGTTVSARVRQRRGSAANPLTDDELKEKFLSNAARRLSEEDAARVHALIVEDSAVAVSDITDAAGFPV